MITTRVKSHILALMMMGIMTMPAWAVGTVNQSLAQIPGSTNYVFTENWTADAANGSVPATVMLGTIAIQGFRIISVEIAPGSPAPTNLYAVTITDFSGADILAGSGGSQSNTTAGVLPSLSNAPPVYGSLTVNVTGNSVNSAQGKIFVYFAPVSQIVGNTSGGPTLTANNLFTGSNTFQGTGTYSGTNSFTGPTSITGTTLLNGCQYVDANQTFAAALAAVVNPGCIQITPGTYTVGANSTIPVGVSLVSTSGGVLSIANTFTLTINGPIVGAAQPLFAYVGTGVVALGTLPASAGVYDVWFPGSDRINQWQNVYTAMPSTGGLMYWLSNGSCVSASSSATFTTLGKPLQIIAQGPTLTSGGTNTGACINWTPTSASTMITIDWSSASGGGNNPAGGISGGSFINNACNTNGGCGSSATGLAIAPTNGGAQSAMFQNVYFRGWGKAVDMQGGLSFNQHWLNDTWQQNTIGFNCSSPSGIELLNFQGGMFLQDGTGVSSCNTSTWNFNMSEFDSNTTADFAGSCGANAVTFAGVHFENLNSTNSARVSCGGNGNFYFSGANFLEDNATGNAAFAFNGGTFHGSMFVNSSGRTFTNFFNVGGAGSDIEISCTSSNAICPNNASGLGLIFGGSNNTLRIDGNTTVPRINTTQFYGQNYLSTETTTPAGIANVDVCYGDSTAHSIKCSYNNGTFFAIPQAAQNGLVFDGVYGTYRVTTDQTITAGASLTNIPGLSWTFPANTALNVKFTCDLLYSQATAAASDSFGFQDVTVAPTNAEAYGRADTSTTAFTAGNTDAAGVTTAVTVVTYTPSAATTVFGAHIDGLIEQPSNASTSVFNIMAQFTTNNGTIKRGSSCQVF